MDFDLNVLYIRITGQELYRLSTIKILATAENIELKLSIIEIYSRAKILFFFFPATSHYVKNNKKLGLQSS